MSDYEKPPIDILNKYLKQRKEIEQLQKDVEKGLYLLAEGRQVVRELEDKLRHAHDLLKDAGGYMMHDVTCLSQDDDNPCDCGLDALIERAKIEDNYV